MLPVLDTPVVHYAVEEAVAAGIADIVLVVSDHKEAIGRYFDSAPELEQALRQRGDDALLARMQSISGMAEIRQVRQHDQLGTGHAVLSARPLVGDEPFAVFLPDDLIWSDSSTIGRMTELFDTVGGSVIALREVPDAMVPSLGIVDATEVEDRLYQVAGLVEKPSLAEAPSNLAIIGRYVLTPSVFEMIEATPPGANGEIQLTDAIARLLPSEGVYGYRFPGTHFDTGTPLGLLKASIYAALGREELGADLRKWLGGLDTASP
jgi:UTP--glucose-1-phosphate uridylyltransferase